MTIMPASVLFPGAFYSGVYQIHSSDDVEIKQRLGPRTKKGFLFLLPYHNYTETIRRYCMTMMHFNDKVNNK